MEEISEFLISDYQVPADSIQFILFVISPILHFPTGRPQTSRQSHVGQFRLTWIQLFNFFQTTLSFLIFEPAVGSNLTFLAQEA